MTLSLDSLLGIKERGTPRLYVVIPNTAALATAGQIIVDTGAPGQHFMIRRLRLTHVSGTGTTWNVRGSGTTGFADSAAYWQLRDTDTELSTATPINESMEVDDGWVVADANGKVYLKLTFGTASDHVLAGEILLEPIWVLPAA